MLQLRAERDVVDPDVPLRRVGDLLIHVLLAEVATVRLKVSLIDRFTTSLRGRFLYLRKFSRTRSKTTTVSFNE